MDSCDVLGLFYATITPEQLQGLILEVLRDHPEGLTVEEIKAEAERRVVEFEARKEAKSMKVTCEFCGGSGNVVTGGGSLVLKPCDRCSGTGRVESRPRTTSLTLACAEQTNMEVRFEASQVALRIEVRDTDGHLLETPMVFLDAEAEASLLRWLRAREEERHP